MSEVNGTYILFVPYSLDGQKTDRWLVETKKDRALLGMVEWFGRWRQYIFAPEGGAVFEHICLNEIALFVEERTKERKAASSKKP